MKKAKILNNVIILILISLLVGSGIWLMVKTFILNQPRLDPTEVAILYLKASQNLSDENPEEFLIKDKEAIKIFEGKYQGKVASALGEKKMGPDPIFKVKGIDIKKTEATAKIEETTGKKEGFIFYGLFLPRRLIFDFLLEKEGNWKEGYAWKIKTIVSPDLVKRVKIGGEVEIEKGIFLKVSNLEEYAPTYLGKGVSKDEKLMSLWVEFKNNSQKKYEYSSKDGPIFWWLLKNKEGEIFPAPDAGSGITMREPRLEKWRYSPVTQELLWGKEEVLPSRKKGGYITFKIPRDFLPTELIIQSRKQIIIYEL